MPLRTAYKLCSEAIFMPVDYAEYSRVSAIIKTTLKEFTELVEDVGIDEAFLDISHSERPPAEIAYEIKKRIRNETGFQRTPHNSRSDNL
jgi:DNA polymerase-4